MVNIDEIKKAIDSHSKWKIQLNMIIETGKPEIPIEIIRSDNQCDFGKWLYGSSISSKDKSSTHYKSVRLLHSEFHRIAYRVVNLALNNNNEEAMRIIAPDGDYTKISAKLTHAMTEWMLAIK